MYYIKLMLSYDITYYDNMTHSAVNQWGFCRGLRDHTWPPIASHVPAPSSLTSLLRCGACLEIFEYLQDMARSFLEAQDGQRALSLAACSSKIIRNWLKFIQIEWSYAYLPSIASSWTPGADLSGRRLVFGIPVGTTL